MRIIAGSLRGRRLQPVGGRRVRPTADRVREALFSILEAGGAGGRPRDAQVLDLFAGTGALGIEALSRGARRATFVESDAAACRTVRGNLERCGLLERSRLVPSTVERFLAAGAAGDASARYRLVFLDPPYAAGLECAVLEKLDRRLLAENAVVVVEHAAGTALPDQIGRLERFDRRAYGRTALSFYGLKLTAGSPLPGGHGPPVA
ncbi:MAG: 16S rRNA (guanine(966)-N(2))-methyltransferase RsmD [Acidobacteriota bacterium]